MVQDARRPDPQYKGLIHGTGQIIKHEGFRGVYRGLFPVIMKQGTNSAVRFTSYQSMILSEVLLCVRLTIIFLSSFEAVHSRRSARQETLQ